MFFYVLQPYKMFDAFVCFICCIMNTFIRQKVTERLKTNETK